MNSRAHTETRSLRSRIEIRPPSRDAEGQGPSTRVASQRDAQLLTPPALEFLAGLELRFRARRRDLLEQREESQRLRDAGYRPGFLESTRAIREDAWRIAPVPNELLDRRVEITGPVDRKMIINALNSGAQVFMADFEDSTSPTWDNLMEGQRNLVDAIEGSIEYVHPSSGKQYRLNPDPAVLFVRPRGWHLEEKHVLVDGAPISASLFDFGLYLFHNAHALLAKQSGPWFYLPKLESHLEARLWNDVFVAAQAALGIERGTIKATCLIETLPAAFEMDEILYELREHSAGLNCGRWDYIFSFIKSFRSDPTFVLPDRGSIGMDRRFLSSYSQLLIQTCHRRGAHAMGGMAAQIPIRGDEPQNRAALARVSADKDREARNGHDGTWVAHPDLIPIARAAFDRVLEGPNQLHVLRADVRVTEEDLLAVPEGTRTDKGLRHNLDVGVRYLSAWLCGRGCVPIHHLMEDAATAEISRTQLWQWRRHGAALEDGRIVGMALIRTVLAEELESIRRQLGAQRFHDERFQEAARLFEELIANDPLQDFLTQFAYDAI